MILLRWVEVYIFHRYLTLKHWGIHFKKKTKKKVLQIFLESFERIFLTKEIEKQTILIRKSYKIKLPDAIIAATAMVYNLTLVTHNVDDFKKIQGLKTLHPF